MSPHDAHMAPATSQPPEGPTTGRLSLDDFVTAVPSFNERHDRYEPQPEVLSRLQRLVDGVNVVVALGTWCHDTVREVPRFLKVVDVLASSGASLEYELIGFDRTKQQPEQFETAFRIQRLPTFIVYRQGVEVSRIVERPFATLEEDLASILESATK